MKLWAANIRGHDGEERSIAVPLDNVSFVHYHNEYGAEVIMKHGGGKLNLTGPLAKEIADDLVQALNDHESSWTPFVVGNN